MEKLIESVVEALDISNACPSRNCINTARTVLRARLLPLLEAGEATSKFISSQPTNRNFLPHESLELRERNEKFLTAKRKALEGAE